MSNTYKVTAEGWTRSLAMAIVQAEDGDVIIVPDGEVLEAALEAIGDKKIEVQLENDDSIKVTRDVDDFIAQRKASGEEVTEEDIEEYNTRYERMDEDFDEIQEALSDFFEKYVGPLQQDGPNLALIDRLHVMVQEFSFVAGFSLSMAEHSILLITGGVSESYRKRMTEVAQKRFHDGREEYFNAQEEDSEDSDEDPSIN